MERQREFIEKNFKEMDLPEDKRVRYVLLYNEIVRETLDVKLAIKLTREIHANRYRPSGLPDVPPVNLHAK